MVQQLSTTSTAAQSAPPSSISSRGSTNYHRRLGTTTTSADGSGLSDNGVSRFVIKKKRTNASSSSLSSRRCRRCCRGVILIILGIVPLVMVWGNVTHWWWQHHYHYYYSGDGGGEERFQVEHIHRVQTVPRDCDGKANCRSAIGVRSSSNNDNDDDNPDIVPSRHYDSTSSDTNHAAACAHTDGIYHSSMGDVEGGVGTALVQLVVVQILYAQQVLNLTPWVHFQANTVGRKIKGQNTSVGSHRCARLYASPKKKSRFKFHRGKR